MDQSSEIETLRKKEKWSVQWRLSGQANKACSLPMQTKFWFYRFFFFFLANVRANSALNLSYKHTIKKLTKILSRSASGPKHKQTLILIDISKKMI